MTVLWWMLAGCVPDLGTRSIGAHADQCGSCHPDEAAALQGSRHAAPNSSPLFRVLREQAEQELGAGPFCDGCHRAEGIRCVDCHGAIGGFGADGVLNGQLVLDPTGPVRAGQEGQGAPHATVEGAFLQDSALCGTCHEVEGPPGFVEQPYTAWQAWGGRGTCQDCHLDGHAFIGLQTDPVRLLDRGMRLEAREDGVRLTNLAGHAFPDGASVTRELWVESRVGGAWSGDVVPLHPRLWRDGVEIANPVRADAVEHRSIAPRAFADLTFEAPGSAGPMEVCVRFRALRRDLAEEIGLPVPDAETVRCIELLP